MARKTKQNQNTSPELLAQVNPENLRFSNWQDKKAAWRQVNKLFEERGYTLLSKEYINSRTKMDYICNKHPDVIQSIHYNGLSTGRGCRICAKNFPVKSIEQANSILT